MRQTYEWPGEWTKEAPRVSDHPPGAELAWLVRGHPFTRPVIARTNVGVGRLSQSTGRAYAPFVRVELMADGFHGQQASDYGFFKDLEWLGPVALHNTNSGTTPVT